MIYVVYLGFKSRECALFVIAHTLASEDWGVLVAFPSAKT